ncbi:MAG: methyltransferase domain-containing protein [Candidatus Pacearchaeota archaeon]|jgi:ubiquinone/menaquinone biosynthesis C-methylase UbiE
MLAKSLLWSENPREKKAAHKIGKKFPYQAIIPKKFIDWNQKWQAPFNGMFSYQRNNTTRVFEYPWAFYAVPLKKGMKVLEIGGAFSGFQFVLDKYGAEVHNLDPGEGKGGKKLHKRKMSMLNKKFETNVIFHNCFIEKANLPNNYFDMVYSISTIEHVNKKELDQIVKHIKRILKPKGHFVLTADLFLTAYPFTKKKRDRWGDNKNIEELVKASGLKIVQGNKKELFGYPEFDKEKIMQNLERYIIGHNYPVLTQALVLQKE